MSTQRSLEQNSNHFSHEDEGKLKALNENFAIIEFDSEGFILSANENFLDAMGYKIEEIKGEHHKIFCTKEDIERISYKRFWQDLSEGKSQIGEFKRIKQDKKSIWLSASYTPIKDDTGKVTSVVKFAQDNTDVKMKNADFEGKVDAISKAQAVIEFNLDGTIIEANENFLMALGYSMDEIRGQHHRIFCEESYSNSKDYQYFWNQLNCGEFESGEYKRIGKGGREVWINASYNPILDADGKVFKVVKFATDVTEDKIKNVDYQEQLKAIDKSQAVIEFNLDGTIIDANENFLSTVGYSIEEIKGKHHRIFCENSYSNSLEYRAFWNKLNSGEFDSGEYKRVGKTGREVWINASYNPILDINGKVCKVVKYATDLTKEKELYNSLVNKFDEGAKQLLNSSQSLAAAATQMSTSSEYTLNHSQTATIAAKEVSEGVKSVGVSTEEMAASIEEISRTSTKTSNISQEAKVKSEGANARISDLGAASIEIGKVIKVIYSIAQQTNLLALNATIEAARAGEAGKGFAVVANEVKELAKQTAQATDDIANKITNVQTSTNLAVDAISEISSIIESINEIAGTTASAVEEQSATTNEVSQIVKDSSVRVDNISKLISDVSTAAKDSSQGASKTLDLAENLTELASNLQTIVDEAKA